jgi:tetratricopeptide (TPR) repeat protein
MSMLFAASVAAADTATTSSLLDIFEEANVAASRADYRTAVQGYERLVDAGVRDADVYFNLGTAYAQGGAYPSAILNYERSLELRPNDDKTQDNLRAAEKVLEERRAEVEGEAEIQRSSSMSDAVYSSFPEDTLAYSLIVANLAFFACLALSWMRRRRARKLIAAAVLSGAILIFCALGLATKSGVFRDGLRAVVVGDRVSLREGPDPKASMRGIARGGDRALVTATDGDFLKLRVISGAEGWVDASSVGLVDPDERLH